MTESPPTTTPPPPPRPSLDVAAVEHVPHDRVTRGHQAQRARRGHLEGAGCEPARGVGLGSAGAPPARAAAPAAALVAREPATAPSRPPPHPQRRHRLAADELPQAGPQHRTAVGAAAVGRAAGALELQLPAAARRVHHLWRCRERGAGGGERWGGRPLPRRGRENAAATLARPACAPAAAAPCTGQASRLLAAAPRRA
jgi:hypothetical protein